MNPRGRRRVIDAGDSALLLQVSPAASADTFDPEINQEAIAVADAIRQARPPGVRDVVPTYGSVALFFDPLEGDVDALRAMLEACRPSSSGSRAPRTVEVPVVYGAEWGPDLDDVAAFAGCDTETVIERHVSRTYRVFMLGFLPGFPYMAPVDDSIAAPRRPTPRISIPAGSVGIAGRQTGIYPSSSPGGWQIIGRTPLTLIDPDRTPLALFAPGDSVRFTRASRRVLESHEGHAAGTGHPAPAIGHPALAITVLKPGLLTTIQDRGRWGYQHLGVPPAGPMDPVAHERANRLVGNSSDAATLEMTVAGPDLRFEHAVRFAIAGADLAPEMDGERIASDTPTNGAAGSVLRFGGRRAGGRAYVAFGGGIDVPAVLGSRATHVAGGIGGLQGRLLRAGDALQVSGGSPSGSRTEPEKGRPASVGTRISGGARLRVMRGPHVEYFDESVFELLQRSRFVISPQSNRMGYRLSGPPIPAAFAGDMMSDATFTGALQVPPSGEPILLMADRQTTGGYPQIAVVISADLSVAGQLLPGDWVEFELCTRAAAIAALVEQRRSNGFD